MSSYGKSDSDGKAVFLSIVWGRYWTKVLMEGSEFPVRFVLYNDGMPGRG